MKRSVVAIIAVVSMILISVGVTVAMLLAASQPVVNTFTVGHVQVSLSETTGENYLLIPGTTQPKDPMLTVKAGSERCWLFFKLEKSPEFDNYVTYTVEEGWAPLDGYPNVYYRPVNKVGADTGFALLQDNRVFIHETLTEQLLANLEEAPPKITFTGYAAQRDGVATAQQAWQQVLKEGGQLHD